MLTPGSSRVVLRLRCALRALGSVLIVVYHSLICGLGRLNPALQLALGFLSYVVLGLLLLSLPIAQNQHVGPLDNLFNVTSAISTTGLVTVSVGDSYSFFGQLVILCLFQLGGIGYMTISSFIILARGRALSDVRAGVLRTAFTMPRGFSLPVFVRNVVVFTVIIETFGAALLYSEFRAAGVDRPLWSAIFHCVSAFATAGFGLYNDSLVRFADNPVVCGTIGVLCYLAAIGFIVIQDAWHAVRSRAYRITFTSKVILGMTAAILALGAPLLYMIESSIHGLPGGGGWLAAAFQIMTASTTAGFNTVPIDKLGHASLAMIITVMVIGASPSGTGGGIKTTTVSSLLAILWSTVQAHERVTFFGHEIPLGRLFTAVASATLYLTCLTVGVFLLCLVESHSFLAVVFEAASALGTVGLSMGISGALTGAGKMILVLLMFIGRVGPLTIGLAFFQGRAVATTARLKEDLAV